MSGGAYHGMRGDQVKLSSNRFFYFFFKCGFSRLAWQTPLPTEPSQWPKIVHLI